MRNVHRVLALAPLAGLAAALAVAPETAAAQAPTPTQPAVYQNGWHDYPSTAYEGVRVSRTADGIVHVQGLAQAPPYSLGSGQHVIFRLPEGFRPAARLITAQACVGNLDMCRVDVLSSGDVVLVRGGMNANAWLSLSNLSFRVP